jgi:general secretion pathway protein F
VDALKLRLPVVGHLNRLVAVARFCRTLSTLLVSGVPILQALAIVQGTVGNVVLSAAIASAATNIQEGQSIAAPLKASGQFPPMVTHMIAIGERTGELEKMLTVVADSYDDEVETAIAGLTSVLAPLAILVMGGIVLFVALGLLLPMTQLSRMI